MAHATVTHFDILLSPLFSCDTLIVPLCTIGNGNDSRFSHTCDMTANTVILSYTILDTHDTV